MGEQYFAARPKSRRRPAEIHFAFRGHAFTFRSDAGVFSGGKIDRGTELLLDALEVGPCELILDLGCGYGAIGIIAAGFLEFPHVRSNLWEEGADDHGREQPAQDRVAGPVGRPNNAVEPRSRVSLDATLFAA